jgi:succinoglycan biosynthesis transport protein ExoP
VNSSFEPFEFVEYVRQRLAVAGIVIGCALIVALAVSFVLPKKYTATATIVIEPPGGIDPRVSTAVSPVYLESLKTYEQFASSDSLFARACAKFNLLSAPDAPSIEAFKKRVLEVKKPKETKLLTISVTLRDPKTAQALVQYLASETVRLSSEVGGDSDRHFAERGRALVEQKRAELVKAQAAATTVTAANLETSLEAEVQSLARVQSTLVAEIAETRALLAEYQGREAQLVKSHDGGRDIDFVREELAAQRAKTAALETSLASVTRDFAAKSGELAKARARRDAVLNQLRAAQNDFDLAVRRLSEIDAASGMRSEQLRIIDPGIVPERPSSPNLPLNCAAAVALGTMASLAYLGMKFGLEKHQARYMQSSFTVAQRDSA